MMCHKMMDMDESEQDKAMDMKAECAARKKVKERGDKEGCDRRRAETDKDAQRENRQGMKDDMEKRENRMNMKDKDVDMMDKDEMCRVYRDMKDSESMIEMKKKCDE